MIGAGAAAAVYLFLEAGMLSFIELTDLWIVGSLSFLAGFSERWFLGVLADVEKGAK